MGKPTKSIIVNDTNNDELVKSQKTPFFVIPAKAGIQFFQLVTEFLDSGFHRSDDFLRNHQQYTELNYVSYRDNLYSNFDPRQSKE